jgi:hypothetical protein
MGHRGALGVGDLAGMTSDKEWPGGGWSISVIWVDIRLTR